MRPIDSVLDGLYRATGRKPTGKNPYNCVCPVHGGKKRSLTVTERADGQVALHCKVCGKERSEEILRVSGLEYTALFPLAADNQQNGLDGKSLWDGKSLRQEQLAGVKEASSKSLSELYSALKDKTQTLPPALKAGWEQVLDKDEWASLLALVRERADRRANRDDLSFSALVYAGACAAAAAFATWDPDRGARLTTYARTPIREAIKKEAQRQSSGPDEEEPNRVALEGQDVAEIPEDAYNLEPGEHPPACLECGDPIPRHKPIDAKFCSDAHRKRHHYRNQDSEAEDYSEAIKLYYDNLPPTDPKWETERNFLRETVHHIGDQKLYIQQLEALLLSGPDNLKSNPAYFALRDQIKTNRSNQVRGLMRSTWETDGTPRWSQTARTLANKRALVADEYDADDESTGDYEDG
jgi:hypothetical protein